MSTEVAGQILIRGKVLNEVDNYRDIKHKTAAEEDVNTIINCLSTTNYGKEMAELCRGRDICVDLELRVY